jgi:hypothetical protein
VNLPKWKDVALFFWVLAIYMGHKSSNGSQSGLSYFGLDVFDLPRHAY